MRHEAESRDVKVVFEFDPVSSTTLRRNPCSCGWRGCWFRDEAEQEASFARHVQQATKAEELARYVGPEPAVYANGDPEAL